MKTPLLILIFVLACVSKQFSQDTLFIGAGKIITGKVIEIGTDVVKYKKLYQTDGPLYNIAKSEVSSIHYLDGTRDYFSSESSVETQSFVMVHVAGQDDQLIPLHQAIDTRAATGNNQKAEKGGQLLGALLILGAELAVVSAMEKHSNKVNNSNRSYYNNKQNYPNKSCCSNYGHCSHRK